MQKALKQRTPDLKIFALFLLLFFISAAAAAESDDITQMGRISPLFYLENPFTSEVITSNGENLTVQIDNAVAENDRILIRFFLADVPESWKEKVTDDTRLYGSYLPIAEILLDDGTIITPSSESRYSLLEFNSRLIIGGLLVFNTDNVSQAFYFNFNQVPFDTQPLREGFSKAVILTSAGNQTYGNQAEYSITKDELTFSLASSAQTNSFTMLQPSVKMERQDEILSKFGWITISDSNSGKYFSAVRGNLYGFNLADDIKFSPAHSYVFESVFADHPLTVTMENAWVVRTFSTGYKITIDLSSGKNTPLINDDIFRLTVSGLVVDEVQDRIRLYIDSGDRTISDILFSIKASDGTIPPTVYCGIDPKNDDFACDIFFGENSFPGKELDFEINGIEYLKEDLWSFQWNPVPMEFDSITAPEIESFTLPNAVYGNPEQKEHPKALRDLLNTYEFMDRELLSTAGWIHESCILDYRFSEESIQELIPTDEYSQYLTQYELETWYDVSSRKTINRILTVIRNPISGDIISASLEENGNTLDLIHKLLSINSGRWNYEYISYKDFRDICNSSADFISADFCSDNSEFICCSFYQSLTGVPSAKGNQDIVFRIDKNDYSIEEEFIDYDHGTLLLNKKMSIPEKSGNLPDDLQQLLDSVL